MKEGSVMCAVCISTDTPTLVSFDHTEQQRNTMKQTFFLLALLLALAAATTQFDEDLRSEGAHETECHAIMDACKAYLTRQCTASTMPITWPWKWRLGSCLALKQRCCNQLEHVPPTCRCKAIRSTVQEMQLHGHHPMLMSKVKQMAKTLPSICKMYPNYCNIPTTNESCYC